MDKKGIEIKYENFAFRYLTRSLVRSLTRCLIAFRFSFKVEKHLFDMGFIARYCRTCKTSFVSCFVVCFVFSVWVWSTSSLCVRLFSVFRFVHFVVIRSLLANQHVAKNQIAFGYISISILHLASSAPSSSLSVVSSTGTQ